MISIRGKHGSIIQSLNRIRHLQSDNFLKLIKSNDFKIIVSQFHTSARISQNLVKASKFSRIRIPFTDEISWKTIDNKIYHGKLDIEETELILSKVIDTQSFKKFWSIIDVIISKDESLLSNKCHILILKVISLEKNSDLIPLAISTFQRLMEIYIKGGSDLAQHSIEHAYNLLLTTFQTCDNLSHLIPFKYLFEHYIHQYSSNPKLELLYLQTYINILLNTNQSQQAIELFEQSVSMLITSNGESDGRRIYDISAIMNTLPTIRILDQLCSDQNFDTLARWLTLIQEHEALNLQDDKWFKYLKAGLDLTNYDLVRTVYDNFIMKGYPQGITTKDLLFQKKELRLNKLLSITSEDTIYETLHVFAINGDVSLTLQLVESHFIHKSFKGEQALSSKLCIYIITAYCHANQLIDNKEEFGIRRVLDVLDDFIKFNDRQKGNDFTYRDLTDPMSHQFFTYNSYDINVEKSKSKALLINDIIKNSEKNLVKKDSILPRKIRNTNIHFSKQGNVLSNLTTLQNFVGKTINYMIKQNHDTKSLRIFINCILNHINIYQNFTGILQALQILKSLDFHMAQNWLNEDLISIILSSLSKSQSTKLSSLVIFQYFKQNYTHCNVDEIYYSLITASVRGDNYHALFEYYCYKYLIDSNGNLSPKISSFINELTKEKPTDSRLYLINQFFRDTDQVHKSKVDEFWNHNELNETIQKITDDTSSYTKRIYNYKFDVLNSVQLEEIFNGQRQQHKQQL